MSLHATHIQNIDNRIKHKEMLKLQHLTIIYCRRPESNRYGRLVPQDFKSCASASSATPAYHHFHGMGPTGLEPVTPCL